MEFTVSKNDLVRELGLSQGVVEKKTTIPILSNVLIEAQGDRIILTATDLELGIRCSCPAKVKKEGAGTIPAKKLLDYTRLLPDVDLSLKFLENHWANITCGRSRTKIAGMSRESFPELPQMPEPISEIPVGLLASMISRTSFAISMEESRFTLNGALLLLGSGGMTMVATDGHRLAYVESPMTANGGSLSDFRALIPKKAMGEIVKLAELSAPEAKLVFAGDDNHLFFQFGERLLITRKLTGNFPDYERVLPKDNTNIAKLKKEEIRSAIERSHNLRMSARGRFECSLARARSRFSLHPWRRERARKVYLANMPVLTSRSDLMPSTCSIFFVPFSRMMFHLL